MPRPRLVQLIALTLCGALLVGAASMLPTINRERDGLNMLGDRSDVKNAPPGYAFWIQAFGAFRGIITNVAFIRAENYKDQGRYYDAMQLAEWICQLQPHFPAVWEFQSWNMAWNISVTTFTPEERWHWVYSGATLIRDRGLQYNPRSVNLYKQLAWIFHNKMGATVDEFHQVYKINWAWRMHVLLGAPPPPEFQYNADEVMEQLAFDVKADPLFKAAEVEKEQIREAQRRKAEERGEAVPTEADEPGANLREGPGQTLATYNRTALEQAAALKRIQEIAEAPHTLDELYKAVPETRQMVQDLRELGIFITDDPLAEDRYWSEDGLGFRFFARYRELADPSLRGKYSRRARATADAESLDRLDKIVGVRELRPAGLALVHFLQRKVLLEVYKNDPDHMVKLVQQFGPMDWRHVGSQSLYWSTMALIKAEGTRSDFNNDKTNMIRILLFSLQNLARGNKMFFEPFPDPKRIHLSYLNMMPDPAFIESMNEAYVEYAKRYNTRVADGPGVGDLFSSGHVNFLKEGIRTLYWANRIDAASKYYEYLRETYGRNAQGMIQEQYHKTLRDFVVDTYQESFGIQRETIRAVAGLLQRSLMELAAGNQIASAKLVDQANRFRQAFMDDKAKTGNDRMRLPPIREMYVDVFREIMDIPSVNYLQTLEKVRLWAGAPVFMKQEVYDAVLDRLTGECEMADFDVAKTFPEPPGMDEYRRKAGERGPKEKEETGVTPVQPNNPGG
ncbi:MAG: hypothetical protein JXO22_07635 [Phycisphaerae bacterium]|nr:hypothetical protein [Phycisphaerae bacterium]